MTTATLTTPLRLTAATGSTDFTGTLRRLRLFLRRDRIILPYWVLVFALAPAAYVKSVQGIYKTPAQLAEFADTTRATRTEIAMYGPIFGNSLGQVGLWKAGMYLTLIGIAVILTVVRHTRVDEEAGRSELIDSAAIGRYSGLTAALSMAFGASTAIGTICTAGLLAIGLPVVGSVAYGLGLAMAGYVFTAVAAVTAQLSTSARVARGIAFGVLAVAYIFRAAGDAGSGTLSWLSPQGWSQQIRPFAGERWWVFILPAVAIAALIITAYALLRHRDMGSGLIAQRPGASKATAALAGPFGLAWRMQRATLLAWTLGLSLYGLLIGSAASAVSGQIGDSQPMRDVITRFGGAESLEDSFVAYGFSFLGIAGAAYAISAVLRLQAEESAQRGESILSGAVSRTRWATSHIVFALLGPAVAIAVAGLLGGLIYGAGAQDIGGKLPGVFAGALLQLPAIWLLAAVAVFLFGLRLRFTPVAWGVLAVFGLIFIAGSIIDAPQWVRDLEPFSHLPKLPGGEFHAAPMIWLLVIDVALLVIGLVAFRRRDMR